MTKRFFFALALFLLLSTYNKNINLKINLKYKIEKVIFENYQIVDISELKNATDFLYDNNLFLLQNKSIEKELKKISFIESFEIKKIYPNQVKIKIFEKKPIVILQDKKDKYYFTDKYNLINFFPLKEYEGLPTVFSNKENFEIFYKNLKKNNFPFDIIKKIYNFESKRWDIVTKNNQTIKLPIKNYTKSLKNFLVLKDQQNFDKYKIFDYRINDQLILK